jgi:hypothetical protein
MAERTVLVVVVTNAADAVESIVWLAGQLGDEQVVRTAGYYAAVAAVDRGARAVVVDVGVPTGQDDWRLAELRARQPDATVVVIGDAMVLPTLSATVRADLAVASVDALPPLREVLVTDEPLVRGDQTIARRSRR